MMSETAVSFSDSDQATSKTILFFGNSLTAGFGIDPDQAFPALVQKKIEGLGWDFKVINAGLSGETSAGGVRRIDWVLQRGEGKPRKVAGLTSGDATHQIAHSNTSAGANGRV